MRKHTYAIVTTLLTLLGLGVLFSLRLVGLYSHQALALVLLLGCVWAAGSRVWLVRKRRLHPGLLRGLLGRENRPQLFQAAGRASFWAAAAVACVAVFPRSAELTTLLAGAIGVGLLRVAASLLVPRRINAGPTLVMAAGALVLAFDLGRAVIGGPAAAVRIAPPFEGEWLVLQGGQSPLQSHHLAAYNQRFALDLVRLEGGRIFTGEPGDANATVHSWEQPLVSPADGTVVVARDGMEDSEGTNFVTELEDAAGTSSSSNSTAVSSSGLRTSGAGRSGSAKATGFGKGIRWRSSETPGTPPCRTCISRCRPTLTSGTPTIGRCPSPSGPTAGSWRATIASARQVASPTSVAPVAGRRRSWWGPRLRHPAHQGGRADLRTTLRGRLRLALAGADTPRAPIWGSGVAYQPVGFEIVVPGIGSGNCAA